MMTLTRQNVYRDVWAAPIAEIANRYGFPESALRRICMRLSIPLPKPGYWSRLRAGKLQRQLPLPATSGPESILVDDAGNEISQESKPRPTHADNGQPEPMQSDSQPEVPSISPDSQISRPLRQAVAQDEPSDKFHALIEQQRAFEAQPQNRILVAKALRNPDPLVVLTERALKRGVKDTRGITGPAWNSKSLNVKVHSASIHRALCILDALVKGLKARQFNIAFEKDPNRDATVAVVQIHGESVPFQLTEKTTRSERPLTKEEQIELAAGWTYIPDRYSYAPTGKLKLSVDGRSGLGIEDKKGKPLEERLNEFVMLLVSEAVRCKQRRQEQKQREAAYKRQWEEQYASEQELKRFETVEQMARDWRRATDVRDFLSALETMFMSCFGPLDPDHEIAQWIAWGRQMAGKIDPITKSEKQGGIEIPPWRE